MGRFFRFFWGFLLFSLTFGGRVEGRTRGQQSVLDLRGNRVLASVPGSAQTTEGGFVRWVLVASKATGDLHAQALPFFRKLWASSALLHVMAFWGWPFACRSQRGALHGPQHLSCPTLQKQQKSKSQINPARCSLQQTRVCSLWFFLGSKG